MVSTAPTTRATSTAMYFLEGGLLVACNLRKCEEWVLDNLRTHCNVCVQQFLPFRRRHHCRTCGEVVCSGCSGQRNIRLTDVNVECLTRVCTFCLIRATDASIRANDAASRYSYSYAYELPYYARPSEQYPALPPAPTNQRGTRNQGAQQYGTHHMSMASLESDLTTGSVVQLWPPIGLDNEKERLEIVRNDRIQKDESDPTLQLLSMIVARTLECPVAFIGLLDDDMLWFKASVGWENEPKVGLPREDCLCSSTLQKGETTVVPNTHVDKNFHASTLLVHGKLVGYYAGTPIRVRGQKIGAVCALDAVPHANTTDEMTSTLEAVANIVSEVLEQRIDSGSSMASFASTKHTGNRMSESTTCNAIYERSTRTTSSTSETTSETSPRSSLPAVTTPKAPANPVDTNQSVEAFSPLVSLYSDEQLAELEQPSSYLTPPCLPQACYEKISMAMDLFQTLQMASWTSSSYVGEVMMQELTHGSRRYTRSTTKLTSTCAQVVQQLQRYEDIRIYQHLVESVRHESKFSAHTWVDIVDFQPQAVTATGGRMKVLSHWRQYPDGSQVVVALSGADHGFTRESDLIFGWFVAPCALDDGLGSVTVSCIVAQPKNMNAVGGNLSGDLMKRLKKCISFRQDKVTTMETIPDEAPETSSLSELEPTVVATEVNKPDPAWMARSASANTLTTPLSASTTVVPSAHAKHDERRSYRSFERQEELMLDLLDRTISTQEILAEQQSAMAEVVGYHDTQLRRISSALDRVEGLIESNGRRWGRQKPVRGKHIPFS